MDDPRQDPFRSIPDDSPLREPFRLQRRRRVEGCPFCEQHPNAGPSHDASPRCESGRDEHCTCDTCF